MEEKESSGQDDGLGAEPDMKKEDDVEIKQEEEELKLACDEEDIRQTMPGKSKPCVGKAWRNKAGEYIRYLCLDKNIEYKPGDFVFIESQRSDQPFYICNVTEFKKSKRNNLMVCIRWFYRTTEVPETVYNFLIKDRYTEHGELAIHDPLVKSRELFISNSTDQFPVNVLRGRCGVTHCLDLGAVKQFEPKDDEFFYTLSYNPETRRIASTQGEIRVGPSHQAILPEWEGDVPAIGRPDRYEELAWEPGRTHDHDLLMYLRAARSIAAFAGMCDGGSTEDGCFAAGRDETTAHALDVLHKNDYDTSKALQLLVQQPIPNIFDKQWNEDESRRFVKGLRVHGKDFFKIRAEFMPEKETGELITYYYLWKKTPGASGTRPRGRRHRQSVLSKRAKSTKDSKKKGSSSASEIEDSGGEDCANRKSYYCRHCSATNSKDWHRGGREMKLLCTNCRFHYKKYGELPFLPNSAKNECTFRPISPERKDEFADVKNNLPLNRGDESDSERSYSSRSRSDSGSRTPEEDLSRTTTPGIPQPDLAIQKNGLSVNDIEQDLYDDKSEIAKISSSAPVVPEVADKAVAPIQDRPLNAPVGPERFAHHPWESKHPGEPRRDQTAGQAQPPAASAPVPKPSLPFSNAPDPSLYVGPHYPESRGSPNVAHSGNSIQSHSESTFSSPASSAEVQILESESSITPHSPSTVVREPSPEPRIDDIECHRSQSAIFVRHLNRGENNSCSRTDLFFKPVPDSKLARKREERSRKILEKEERERAMEGKLPTSTGLSPGMRAPHGHPANSFSSLHDRLELDRLEKERRDRELMELRDRENRLRDEMMRRGALRLPGLSPQDPYLEASRRFASGLSSPFNLGDRLAVERMALSGDPLARLQMAGINPEVSAHNHTHLHMHPDPGFLFQQPSMPSYQDTLPGLSDILALSGLRPGYRPPHPFGDMAGLRGPGADYLSRLMAPPGMSGQEALQRQLMLERDRGLLAASGGLLPGAGLSPAHLQQRQHEEFLRSAREREANSRPPGGR